MFSAISFAIPLLKMLYVNDGYLYTLDSWGVLMFQTRLTKPINQMN